MEIKCSVHSRQDRVPCEADRGWVCRVMRTEPTKTQWGGVRMAREETDEMNRGYNWGITLFYRRQKDRNVEEGDTKRRTISSKRDLQTDMTGYDGDNHVTIYPHPQRGGCRVKAVAMPAQSGANKNTQKK